MCRKFDLTGTVGKFLGTMPKILGIKQGLNFFSLQYPWAAWATNTPFSFRKKVTPLNTLEPNPESSARFDAASKQLAAT